MRDIAARATWLGNDETHYTRLWNGKDVNDLKELIDMVISHIRDEERYARLMVEMPKGRP